MNISTVIATATLCKPFVPTTDIHTNPCQCQYFFYNIYKLLLLLLLCWCITINFILSFFCFCYYFYTLVPPHRVDLGRSWLELQLSVLSTCAGNFLILSPLAQRSDFPFPLSVLLAAAVDIVAVASLAAAGVAFHGRLKHSGGKVGEKKSLLFK